MPIAPDSDTTARKPERDPHHVDLSRRKLGLGLGVSAVFTLASRPVLAGTCLAPSSAASGNLSTHGTTPLCAGNTPEWWVNFAASRSPAPNSPDNGYPGGNVKFHEAFASGGSANWGNDRLYVVMGGTTSSASSRRSGVLGSPSGGDTGDTGDSVDTLSTTTGPNPISAEFAATLLNIRDGLVPEAVLNETKLIGMWNEWLTTGTYSPMAGATWNTDQIVAYLRSLQGSSL